MAGIADLSQAELACRMADSPAASLHSQALALIHRAIAVRRQSRGPAIAVAGVKADRRRTHFFSVQRPHLARSQSGDPRLGTSAVEVTPDVPFAKSDRSPMTLAVTHNLDPMRTSQRGDSLRCRLCSVTDLAPVSEAVTLISGNDRRVATGRYRSELRARDGPRPWPSPRKGCDQESYL